MFLVCIFHNFHEKPFSLIGNFHFLFMLDHAIILLFFYLSQIMEPKLVEAIQDPLTIFNKI